MWSNLWIKAKDFAAEMTSVNVQAKDFHGENRITKSILITMLLYARCSLNVVLFQKTFRQQRMLRRLSAD